MLKTFSHTKLVLKSHIIWYSLGMEIGWSGDAISYLSPKKKFINIFISKCNRYKICVLSPSNGYSLILLSVPLFLRFQYQLINFYKIIKNYGKGSIILSNVQY